MDQPPSATLPRGFRYGDALPRTPEPFPEMDTRAIPSPPRPRLRLKRRNVSNLRAPTQQFLASVAAADVPIPSIEEPNRLSAEIDTDTAASLLRQPLVVEQDSFQSLKARGRTPTQPKTPVPGVVPSLSPRRYPDWTIDSTISSIESTPDREFSRPSTSRSTETSDSVWSRLSQVSDSDHCISPDAAELDDPVAECIEKGMMTIRPTATRRKAPWTKAMSAHLWSTYVLYLQDPKVTPFRMGKSCIPPNGVCLRIAREAKRSWRGGRAPNTDGGKKSGSTTPTAESSAVYIQWPHTRAATRSHLRELCRVKASSLSARNMHTMSRSPTPFTQAAARHWNRRSTPSATAFATQDLSKELTISASDSMQPNGPLALLATSALPANNSSIASSADQPRHLLGTFEGEPSFAERRRLGSPFSAQSYGPSSSASLAAALGLSTPGLHRQTHTIGPRRTLQSPVRLSRSGTQKRKNNQSSEPRKRPSLGADTWMDPQSEIGQAEDSRFSSTSMRETDSPFIPRLPKEPFLASSISMPDVGKHLAPPISIEPAPRLGSPFSNSSSSFSFPNRLRASTIASISASRRPFATFQQQPQEQPVPVLRSDLASRLAYLDRRLKEIHQDGNRRSASPSQDMNLDPFGQ
jgi:hypothetical protein